MTPKYSLDRAMALRASIRKACSRLDDLDAERADPDLVAIMDKARSCLRDTEKALTKYLEGGE